MTLRYDSDRLERVVESVGVPAIACLDRPGRPLLERRIGVTHIEHVAAVLRGVAVLQAVSQEPTIRNLSRASGLTRAQVNRVFERCRLDHLPAAAHCQAIEQRQHDEPDAIYLKSWVDVSRGPDKFGAESTVPPAIPAAALLHLPPSVRHTLAATSSGYAIAMVGDTAFAIGHVPLVQGWWKPSSWRKYLRGTGLDEETIEQQLREHAEHRDWAVPLIGDPLGMASELIEQIVAVRDGIDWEHVQLREIVVGSGWMHTGLPSGHELGGGSRLDFVGRDLRSIERMLASSFVPMFDLPQDPQAMRGRGGYPRKRWNLDWEFLLDGEVRTSDEVQADLVALPTVGAPSSRWWKSLDRAVLRAAGVETNVRYRYLHCPVRARGDERFRSLTLLDRTDFQGRGGGWVTTVDPRPEAASDDDARLLGQAEMLQQAEADVRRHRSDGSIEQLKQGLLADGWAQRVKRRKYQERMNAAALALTARTLLDLSRRN